MSKKVLYLIYILIIVSISSCKYQDNDSNLTSLKIFYPDSQAEYWLIEEKEMINEPKSIINELIMSDKNLIPKNTEVLSVEIENSIAYVNLSNEFEDFNQGDMVISINLYTIVNTLCLNNSLNIEAVKFLIDGEEKSYIGGNIGDQEYYPNAKLNSLY